MVVSTTVSQTFRIARCNVFDALRPVMFKRDRIMFNPQNESDDDVNADQGEEVLRLNIPDGGDDYEDVDEGEDELSEEELAPKKRKDKVKPDVTGKGRFGKPIPTSDDEESAASGSESEDDDGWGRQYYSAPSNRREKEKGEYDERREEEREMEEKEVRRLQRKAREGMVDEDWGLDDMEETNLP